MVDVAVLQQVPFVVVVVTTPGQTVFDYDFRVDALEDLHATYVAADGTETQFDGGVNLTATGIGAAAGGTVTLAGFTSAQVGRTLTIYREIAISRPNDYTRDLFAEEINREMDQVFMILQEQKRDISRAAKSDLGALTYRFSSALEDGDTLMKSGDTLIPGPNATDIRDAQGYAESALGAKDMALAAASSAQAELDSRAYAIASYQPIVAPNKIRVAGYAAAGDGGGAIYKKVASQPSHAGKFSITLADAVTVVWYEIAEPVVNVKMFGAKGDNTTDDRASCQAAIDYVVSLGGGKVVFPSGTYRLVGAASPDSKLNGLVIPFISFTVDNRVILEGDGKAVLRAASNNMIILRRCQPGSVAQGLQFDGGRVYENLPSGLTGVWGVCDIPADMTQTTTQVSQSYTKLIDCYVQKCEEGYILAPGPNVGGAGSGCYYPVLLNCDFNLNARGMWFRAGFVPDPTNRPTRGNILNCRIERGNTGIHFEQVTEFNVFGCFMQFLKASPYGATPYASGAGMRLGPLTENVTVYGIETEQADFDYFLDPACLPNAVRIPLGSNLGGVSSNLNFSPVQAETFYRLARRSAAYEQMHITANFTGFARLVFDYTASNVRDAAIETNSVKRMDWFNGKTTHYGSAGNIELLNTGATIQGTASTGLTVTTSGNTLALNAGGKTATISSAGLLPGADNSVALGIASFRWTQLAAATATINTSDARLKDWRGGLNEVELRVAKRLSKLIGIYRWKDAIAAKGDKARKHAGPLAQDVIAAFEAEGLDAFEYGIACYDEWDDFTEAVTELREVAILDEDGNPKIDETGQPVTEMQEVDTGVVRIVKEAGDLYGLRYDELWAFVAAGFEARLSALED